MKNSLKNYKISECLISDTVNIVYFIHYKDGILLNQPELRAASINMQYKTVYKTNIMKADDELAIAYMFLGPLFALLLITFSVIFYFIGGLSVSIISSIILFSFIKIYERYLKRTIYKNNKEKRTIRLEEKEEFLLKLKMNEDINKNL